MDLQKKKKKKEPAQAAAETLKKRVHVFSPSEFGCLSRGRGAPPHTNDCFSLSFRSHGTCVDICAQICTADGEEEEEEEEEEGRGGGKRGSE